MKNLRPWMLRFVCSVTLIMCAHGAALAAAVTINNPSFENPALADGAWTQYATDWVKTGTNGGTYDPPSSEFSWMPNGENCAWVNYSSSVASLSQVTGHALLADQIYTLQVYVGRHKPVAETATYTVELVANASSAVLASASGTAPHFNWATVQVVYQSPHSGGYLGQYLKIVLKSGEPPTTGSRQTDFDMVTLNYVTPTPSTLLLLGSALVGLVVLGRRRITRLM